MSELDLLIGTTADVYLHRSPDGPGAVWTALAETGLTSVGIAETHGGSGGTQTDAAAVVREAARWPTSVPLAETAMLGDWLLSRAGLPLPSGPVTIAIGAGAFHMKRNRVGNGWLLSGKADRVPFGGTSRVALLAFEDTRPLVVSVPAGSGSVTHAINLAGEARPTVAFNECAIQTEDVADAPPGVDLESVRRQGALVRSVQMVGALEKTLQLAVTHARDRVQFGRPIGRFQAIQHYLAEVASEVAAANSAVSWAVIDVRAQESDSVEIAKIAAGRAAGRAATLAHQVLGAMGFTQEHELQIFTRRLWSWREEFGSETYWAARIGRNALLRGGEGLWPAIADNR